MLPWSTTDPHFAFLGFFGFCLSNFSIFDKPLSKIVPDNIEILNVLWAKSFSLEIFGLNLLNSESVQQCC
ncbi:hypothetical protein ACJX0J_027770, partial [Zea mays]